MDRDLPDGGRGRAARGVASEHGGLSRPGWGQPRRLRAKGLGRRADARSRLGDRGRRDRVRGPVRVLAAPADWSSAQVWSRVRKDW